MVRLPAKMPVPIEAGVVENIITPQSDDRSYRGIVLANGLKVCIEDDMRNIQVLYFHYSHLNAQVMLVSDPSTDKSAASLDVNIGSMCDPKELQGLAHFCEHMCE